MSQLKIKKNKGFTLIELIVVISILSILSAIGMVTYTGYLKGVRDVNRISQLKSLSDTLNLFNTKYTLPLPENSIDVIANGVVIAYQGYLGKNIIDKIGYNSEGVDPKTGNYFSYYLTKDKKNFQLMGFLEESNNLQASLINKLVVNANSNKYEFTFPTVYGQTLGILTTELNMPVQENTVIKGQGFIDLGGTNSGTVYISRLSNRLNYSFTGYILEDRLHSLSIPGKYNSPVECPQGFIPVPGNAGFNQEGFCVAKYEMGYTDETGAIWESGGTYNAYTYDFTKEIISATGKYPIVEITYSQAQNACNSIGKGYHLIKKSEYLSLVRGIELNGENWTSGIAGNGYMNRNGVSGTSSIGGCYSEASTLSPRIGGNTEALSYATKSGPGGNPCDDYRQYTLSNGEKIWDLAGNVAELVDKEISSFIVFGTGTVEWNTVSDINKTNNGPLIGIDSNNGIGYIRYADGINSAVYEYGGSARDSAGIGIYGLVPSISSNTNRSDLGFRCAK